MGGFLAEPNEWLIYESEPFVAEVSKYLSSFELGALRQQLARDPFAGKPVPGLSPLISLDFAGATVIYSVNPVKKTVALIQVAKATGKPLEIDAGAKSELQEFANNLKRGGYMAAGKEFFEWLFDIVKDWL